MSNRGRVSYIGHQGVTLYLNGETWNFRIFFVTTLKFSNSEIEIFEKVFHWNSDVCSDIQYRCKNFLHPTPASLTPQRGAKLRSVFNVFVVNYNTLYSLYYYITLYFYGYLKAIQLDAELNKSYACSKSCLLLIQTVEGWNIVKYFKKHQYCGIFWF